MSFWSKVKSFIESSKKLIWISLAAWVMHIILRIFLLFRSNPYGFPFVSKPDWYIFHAICIDFLWICNALIIFMIFINVFNRINRCKLNQITSIIYAFFHSVVLMFTLLDNEMQRFLGSHISFGLLNTYKDTSSIAMLYDYVENDLSIPFLQFILLALMLPSHMEYINY